MTEVARAEVVLSLEDAGFAADLAKAEAQLKASAKAMGQNEVKLQVDFDRNQLNRELKQVRNDLDKELNRLNLGGPNGGPLKKGGKAWKDATANIRELKGEIRSLNIIGRELDISGSIQVELDKVSKTMEDHYRNMAIMHQRALDDDFNFERNRAIMHQRALDEDISFTQAKYALHERALTMDEQFNRSRELEQERAQRKGMEIARAHREALRIEEDMQKVIRSRHEEKSGGFWSILTNSKSPMETLRKTMREPVNFGPFTATPKGLAVGASAFAPIIASIAGGITAMAATVGGALTGAMSVGTAAVLGFGQALAGVGLVIQPIAQEFHAVSLVTNAYATAVQKYGENSKQAKKAQDAMNNTLKAVSPTARAAYQDLAKVQTVFARMTSAARPNLDRILRSGMSTFSAIAPSFAQNTVSATGHIANGIDLFMQELRSDTKKPGGGFLNTTFKDANAAIEPLIGGLGHLVLALGNVGASASRFLKPLATNLSDVMDKFLGKTNNKKALDGTINSLMKDFTSVGKSIWSAGRLLVDFFNVGRSAGRGIFDSITKTFDRWDKFVKSPKGQKELSTFFTAAADGFKKIGNLVVIFAQGFVLATKVMGPFVGLVSEAVNWVVQLTSALLKIGPAADAIRGLAYSITGLLIVSKVVGKFAAFGAEVRGAAGALGLAATEATAAETAVVGVGEAATLSNPAILALVGTLTTAYLAYKRLQDISKNPSELDPRNDPSLIPPADMPKMTPAQQTAAAHRNRGSFMGTSFDQGFVGTRFEAPNGGNNKSLAQQLQTVQNQLVQKGGKRFAVDAFLNLRFNDARGKLDVFNAAAHSKLSAPQIMKILISKATADQMIAALEGRIRKPQTKPVNVATSTDSLYRSLGNGITKNVQLLASVTAPNLPAFARQALGLAEGGVHYSPHNKGGTMAAASGYTKDTAWGSASGRPMRRAMGAFNEPTFLVGEENRTEYVIATNPAYRSANVGYLSDAANALGMDVVPAAGGFNPMIESRGYFDGSRTAKDKREAKKKIDALNNMIYAYDHKKRPKKGPWHSDVDTRRYRQHKQQLAELTAFMASQATSKIISEGRVFKSLHTDISTYDTLMGLADKRGNAADFNRYRTAQLKAIASLLIREQVALRGTTSREKKALLNNDIATLQSQQFDTLNRVFSPAGKSEQQQAQIDQLNAQLTSANNAATINSAFSSVSGGLGDLIASGGPMMSRKSAQGGPTIVINTLHPGDPDTLSAIGDAATAGMSLQPAISVPRMSVG
jgi:hypothetical protein